MNINPICDVILLFDILFTLRLSEWPEPYWFATTHHRPLSQLTIIDIGCHYTLCSVKVVVMFMVTELCTICLVLVKCDCNCSTIFKLLYSERVVKLCWRLYGFVTYSPANCPPVNTCSPDVLLTDIQFENNNFTVKDPLFAP